MLFHKDFESITGEDIKRLIDLEVPEDRQIEYKRELPSNSDAQVKEFLDDVSAFANAAGGIIIYGIKEDEGIPIEICGLEVENVDQEICRLDDIIRSCIQPKIINPLVHQISVDEKILILIRIPLSWSKPHVVNYKSHWRFYIRTSAGKHPMDVEEVRSSMLQSYNLPDKIRKFRDDRLNSFQIFETIVPLRREDNPLVLHLIPFSAVSTPDISQLDFNLVPEKRMFLEPIYSSIFKSRYTLEGYLNYGSYNDGAYTGYVHMYRTGIIESVDTFMLHYRSGGEKYIPSDLFAKEVVDKTNKYLKLQKQIGALPPITMFVSLLNIKGYLLAVNRNLDPFEEQKYTLQRNNLLLPELIFEDYPEDIHSALQPLFDSLWNAFGWPRSLNYDKDGNWKL